MRSPLPVRRRYIPVVTMVVISLTLILIQSSTLPPNPFSDQQFPQPDPEDSLITVRVVAAGDAMAHLPQTQAAYHASSDSYHYADVFQWIAPYIRSFDLAMVNLETTLAGTPYKGYPQFSAPDAYASDLNAAGFSFFCCANNHSVDRYNKGILRTIQTLDSLQVSHTGIFRDRLHRDATYPSIIEMKGLRIAVINATYGTNGLEPTAPVLVNRINKEEIRADLEKTRSKAPDVIIAVMHWGDEYKSFPNAYQKDIAVFLAGEGVDVIVGHHPHVLQPVEWIKGKDGNGEKEVLVIWSLGNFYSNQRSRYRDGGMFVSFSLVKNRNTGRSHVETPAYYPFWVWRDAQSSMFRIFPSELRDSIVKAHSFLPPELEAFDTFNSDTREHLGKNKVVSETFHYTNRKTEIHSGTLAPR